MIVLMYDGMLFVYGKKYAVSLIELGLSFVEQLSFLKMINKYANE